MTTDHSLPSDEKAMNWNRRIIFGIAKEHIDGEPTTFEQMRQAIFKASFDSVLIRNAMQAADIRGLNGEDRYVQLAYHALRHLEDTNQQLMRMIDLTPMPHKILVQHE